MENAIVISVINYKGGVGKTTSTFNIGAGLAYLGGFKVLMIDLDPQCSLTNVCLKAYSRLQQKELKIEDLSVDVTINNVLRGYLKQQTLGMKPDIDLDKLIFKNFYQGEISKLENLDFISATMFDPTDKTYLKGLDDLEIEMAMQYVGHETRLSQLSLIAKFFTDSRLQQKYDFIIFDCPPANNLITQNALIVSDYYLIPTIMDDMSSNGIAHLHSLIKNTIFGQIDRSYRNLIEENQIDYLNYFKKPNPELLGVFETLKKTGSDTDSSRSALASLPTFKGKLFSQIVYHHIDTARATGRGLTVFSVDVQKDLYSPHLCYGKLILEMLLRVGVSIDEKGAKKKMSEWL
ncbi:ParA family protein [Desulfosporosinus hippei]|uniref:Chromosome partitioning protein n=1 Tax=Desulfosporosinus hippei DSM 8344 TaxID=1121419 RepID=A0A1G8L3P7_9FIRM|nr:AAA family ATPase [Desulfosporosinus hippei]SDI50313.1 chromosome partitioning protein [Desulfosporosinus hippei DSM 8344]